MLTKDREILSPLIERYLEICGTKEQVDRRCLWRRLNGLNTVRPLIFTRRFAWPEMNECRTECEDRLLASIENTIRRKIYWATLGDDAIFEPWLVLPASHLLPNGCSFPSNVMRTTEMWGPKLEWISPGTDNGAGRWNPSLKDIDDLSSFVAPHHRIDETTTNDRLKMVNDTIGDLIPVTVDRGPAYRGFAADISTHLALLLGLERMMVAMIDHAKSLHTLLAFMRDSILQVHAEADSRGDWSLISQWNQAETYSDDLPDPSITTSGVRRNQLWTFCAGQEFAVVSPEMFDEFLLQYQIPILEKFGLVHYGCCEVLTHKIKYLRKIPNLRRIGIGLNADVAKCAEQIGSDYVLSYRPSPAEMVSYGFDEARIRATLRRDLSAAKGCNIDITLKDVETVQGDQNRVRRWVQVVRDTIDELNF